MEQLLGEFETLNPAANAKLDSIEEQYSQDDTGIVDTGATSGVAAPKDVEQMDPTGEISKNIFILPDGLAVKATEKLTLRHKLQKGALDMNVTPGVHMSLISMCKMADEGYVTVFDENEFNIYDGKKVKIVISEKAVLKGYRCKNSGLWKIPLKDTTSWYDTAQIGELGMT